MRITMAKSRNHKCPFNSSLDCAINFYDCGRLDRYFMSDLDFYMVKANRGLKSLAVSPVLICGTRFDSEKDLTRLADTYRFIADHMEDITKHYQTGKMTRAICESFRSVFNSWKKKREALPEMRQS